MTIHRWLVAASLAGAALLLRQPVAAACGCFTIPSPATPVVQAGERILFARDGSNVIAYVQIQYQGSASHFGWLVPLPSVPSVDVGTDELFTQLDNRTSAQFNLNYNQQFCDGTSQTYRSSGGCGGAFFGAGGANGPGGPVAGNSDVDLGANPDLVVQASVGPYEYAVLKADDMSAMLAWLQQNGYFVPSPTMDAVKPYIHPGGYFLALKLRAGESTGDIVPVVLKYQSDLPMIPITLTSVGAIPNMGILVWVLGSARAIPRNYYSVVIDDLPVWFGGSYNQQLIDAVHTAPDRHGFVTEYGGSSSIMSGALYYPGRYGSPSALALINSPSQYLRYLRNNGFTFSGTLLAILSKYIPEPPSLVAQGIPLATFYQYYDEYVGYGDAGVQTIADPVALTNEIEAGIVTPSRTTQALLDASPYLTRMYTALSPEDMNLDPVFSFNPELPDVPRVRTATLTFPCEGDPYLTTDQGVEAQYPGRRPPQKTLAPALRIEILADSGAPKVVTNNHDSIIATLGPVDHGKASANNGSGGCGCDVTRRRLRGDATAVLVVAALALLWRTVRRRRSGVA